MVVTAHIDVDNVIILRYEYLPQLSNCQNCQNSGLSPTKSKSEYFRLGSIIDLIKELILQKC